MTAPVAPDRLTAIAAAIMRGARKSDFVRSAAEARAWDAILDHLRALDHDDPERTSELDDAESGISDDEFLDEFA